jgi:hypothetical protein
VKGCGLPRLGHHRGRRPAAYILDRFRNKDVLGAGLGLVMQPLVLAVQNDFPHTDVGTAISAHSFFREIGAILGIAAVGAVFTHRLTERLGGASAGAAGDTQSLTPAMVRALPAEVRDTVILAYQNALTPVFRYLVPVFALGLVLAFLLPEKRLAGENHPEFGVTPGRYKSDRPEATVPTRC